MREEKNWPYYIAKNNINVFQNEFIEIIHNLTTSFIYEIFVLCMLLEQEGKILD